MADFFPYLKDKDQELRKWTIRKWTESGNLSETVSLRPHQLLAQPSEPFEISLDGISRPKSAPMPFLDDLSVMDLDPPVPPQWNDLSVPHPWNDLPPCEFRQSPALHPQDDVFSTLL
jgi:hypothetical protein